MYTLRKLEKNDYFKEYLQLLEFLTTVNANKITKDLFDKFVDGLNDNHIVYVVENNDTIIASGTLFIENKLIHCCGKVAHIEDIVVNPNYKGKHIGSLIVNSLVEYAKSKNCYKVILDCNENLEKFYQKCNFDKKGIQMALYFD